MAHHPQMPTASEAADLLKVSPSTLIRLLEQGEIPYEQVGEERRMLLRDVLTYRERRRHQRREGMDELVRISEEMNLYEITATPRRTR
ncbi:helix-turn-helix domain-containing protein [Planomonospora venezuelensis]|uniref:helix-turn-helix domain-containing protein n=2 Tax=Planomonospora venezuelensis TaxID=1999 RepID=UPI0016158B7C